MIKTRVAVLRGGPSSEYEVSIDTGESVISALDPEKYQAVDVFIDRQGVWHVGGIPKQPKAALSGIDIVWNALHGEYGEDGKVQMLLENLGVPYTGSRAVPSAIAMNKALTKKSLVDSGVKCVQYRLLKKDDPLAGDPHGLFKIIPIPSVVKPVSAGSSVGVSIVRSFADIPAALAKAFDVDDDILIEEYISGKEATCGVVEDFRGEDIYALPPIEIIPADIHGFFSYDAKYGGGTREVCPCDLPEDVKREIERQAALVHRTLGLSHYSRSDFIVHPKRGIYFLEANTLPGLTKESLMPKALRAVGSDLSEFLDHVITIARKGK
jgi:D-alanine-D-alanine ligase